MNHQPIFNHGRILSVDHASFVFIMRERERDLLLWFFHKKKKCHLPDIQPPLHPSPYYNLFS